MRLYLLAMTKSLTKKQTGFVKDYIETGNGTEAVINNYDVKDRIVAKSVASENLTKPYIIEAIKNEEKRIGDLIPDDLLAQRHIELLNKREVFEVFHVGEKEYELIDQPDTQAVTKALDMAYKLKGFYAPDKNVNVNVEIESEEDIKLITEQLNALHRSPSQPSHGIIAHTLDNQAQD